MAIAAAYKAALNKLFRTRPVALLDDLRRALKTRSRTTIFRVLRAIGYRTSYSHAGRYYTLERIPKFDAHGLWRYLEIGFSALGTLRATVIHLVESSPAGQTHQELQDLLHLRMHDTLRLLVHAGELKREPFHNTYVYLSANPKRAAEQWSQRQPLAPILGPAELDPARIIDVLVDVIHHPKDDAGAVCRRLRGLGHSLTPEQVETVFTRYELKKTPPSRSRRWPR